MRKLVRPQLAIERVGELADDGDCFPPSLSCSVEVAVVEERAVRVRAIVVGGLESFAQSLAADGALRTIQHGTVPSMAPSPDPGPIGRTANRKDPDPHTVPKPSPVSTTMAATPLARCWSSSPVTNLRGIYD